MAATGGCYADNSAESDCVEAGKSDPYNGSSVYDGGFGYYVGYGASIDGGANYLAWE